jgi:hypothetical protein
VMETHRRGTRAEENVSGKRFNNTQGIDRYDGYHTHSWYAARGFERQSESGRRAAEQWEVELGEKYQPIMAKSGVSS